MYVDAFRFHIFQHEKSILGGLTPMLTCRPKRGSALGGQLQRFVIRHLVERFRKMVSQLIHFFTCFVIHTSDDFSEAAS